MQGSVETQTGNSSIVKIYPDSGYVIKMPKEKLDRQEYIEKQKHASEIMKIIAQQLKEFGFDINIPLTEDINEKDGIIRESYVPGERFDINVYNTLSNERKKKLAHDLAAFMLVMHMQPMQPGQKIPNDLNSEKLLSIQLDELFERDDEIKDAKIEYKIDKFIKCFHDDSIKRLAQDVIDYFKRNNNDAIAKIIVMRHHDLRDANIRYDTKSNRFGIIDFEGAGFGSIYEDFVGSPPSLSWDFMKMVIEQYNFLSKKFNHDITIDPETVRRWSIFRMLWASIKNNWPEENTKQKLKELGLVKSETINSIKRGINELIKRLRYQNNAGRKY